ncbi:hypothetical protein, partial [Acidaminococcus intestini]
MKRRKHDGSCWNVLRPIFSLRTRCAASIRLTKAGAQKPLDAALQQAGLFGGGEMYPLYWTPSKEGTFCV